MVKHAFNKSSRGQIWSWPSSVNTDGTDWHCVLPMWPATPQDYRRKWLQIYAGTGHVPDSTALSGYTQLVITSLWVWVSLGYHLDENTGLFREVDSKGNGTCVDAHEEFGPMLRVVKGTSTLSTVQGYQEVGPNAGLAVHALIRPDHLLNVHTGGGVQALSPSIGIPLTTQFFFQSSTQPVPMTYHRSNSRNLIPPDVPLVIASGEKCQVEMKNGVTDGMFEFDCYVQGYLED